MTLTLTRFVAAGYMTGEIACGEAAHDLGEKAVGSAEDPSLVAAVTAVICAMRVERQADWSFMTATCSRITKAELELVGPIARARVGDAPGTAEHLDALPSLPTPARSDAHGATPTVRRPPRAGCTEPEMEPRTMDDLSQETTIFEPQDLARLEAAFTGAVAIAAGEDSPYAVLPVHLLRRRLAGAVLAAARRGERDVALLRAEALRVVASTLETRPVRSSASIEAPDLRAA